MHNFTMKIKAASFAIAAIIFAQPLLAGDPPAPVNDKAPAKAAQKAPQKPAEAAPLPMPVWPAPTPGVLRYIAENSLPDTLPQVLADPASHLVSGDEVVLMMTVVDGWKSSQYIITISADAANEIEKTTVAARPFVLFSNTGHRFDYGVRPTALNVTVIGPFGNNKPHVQTTRLVANEDHLSQGFDRACEAFATLKALKNNKENASISLKTEPYSAEEIATAQAALTRVGIPIDPECERALGGVFPSFMSFFSLIMQTDGMDDVVKDLASMPPSLSILLNGINASFDMDGEHIAQQPGMLAGRSRWMLPFTLSINGKSAIRLQIFSERPIAPLSNCAGVYGLYAQSVRKPQRCAYIQLTGAKHAEQPAKQAQDPAPDVAADEKPAPDAAQK